MENSIDLSFRKPDDKRAVRNPTIRVDFETLIYSDEITEMEIDNLYAWLEKQFECGWIILTGKEEYRAEDIDTLVEVIEEAVQWKNN